MGERIECPECGSTNLETLNGPKVNLAAGRPTPAGLMFGPLGAIAGAAALAGRGKTTLRCIECGTTWEEEL